MLVLVSVERLSVSIASLSDIAAQTSESWEQDKSWKKRDTKTTFEKFIDQKPFPKYSLRSGKAHARYCWGSMSTRFKVIFGLQDYPTWTKHP